MPVRIILCTLVLLCTYSRIHTQETPCGLEESVAEIRSNGDYESLQEAEVLLRKCSVYPDSHALVLHSLGVWNYNVVGDLDSAIYYMKEAVAIWSGIKALKDTLGAGKSNFNLGYFLKDQERYLEAEPYLRRAASWYDLIGADARLLFAYLQLGQVQENNGAYTNAADFYRLAMRVAHGNDDQLGKAKALNDLGGLLSRQKDYSAAQDTLLLALELFQVAEDDPDLPACQNQLGVLYAETGQHQKAVAYFSQALQGFEEWEDCRRAAIVANNLGDELLVLGDLPKAYRTLTRGMDQAVACESPEIIAQSHDHLGEYYLRKGQFPVAEEAFRTALKTLVPNWNSNSKADDLIPLLAANPHKLDIFIYLRDLARAKQEQYRLSEQRTLAIEALEWYQAADQLSDELRAGHYDEANKLFWREQVLPFYEAAIACAHSVDAVEQAHLFFEKSQAILLFEAIDHTRKLSQLPGHLREQEQRLKAALSLARGELMQASSQSQSQGVAVLSAEDELTNFYQELSEVYPEFSPERQGLLIDELSAFQEQYLLPNSLSLVQYFWGQERLYALSVQDGEAQLFDLGEVQSLSEKVTDFLRYFSSAGQLTEDPSGFAAVSFELFNEVLEPIFSELPPQVLIVPSGPLAYVPFEALITQNTNDQPAYLIHSTRVSYAYSTALHAQLQSARSEEQGGRVLALAPFSEGGTGGFAALPNSQLELDELQSMFAGDYLHSASATRASFLAKANTYSLLHLSTHAQSVSDRAQPFIALYDSLVWLSDLYRLHLPAELVVLSACQTNTGELAKGEGVLGLGRGFFYAGASSVIASLWNLNDRHTAQIMKSFYQELATGTAKAEALHKAKLAFMQDASIPAFQRTPYYWAGLSFYGNPSPMKLEGNSSGSSVWLILAGALLLAILAWLWRKRNLRSTDFLGHR